MVLDINRKIEKRVLSVFTVTRQVVTTFIRLLLLNLGEGVSPETVLPDLFHTLQLVLANGRCNPSPDYPVEGTNSKDCPASNGMRPVG